MKFFVKVIDGRYSGGVFERMRIAEGPKLYVFEELDIVLFFLFYSVWVGFQDGSGASDVSGGFIRVCNFCDEWVEDSFTVDGVGDHDIAPANEVIDEHECPSSFVEVLRA